MIFPTRKSAQPCFGDENDNFFSYFILPSRSDQGGGRKSSLSSPSSQEGRKYDSLAIIRYKPHHNTPQNTNTQQRSGAPYGLASPTVNAM